MTSGVPSIQKQQRTPERSCCSSSYVEGCSSWQPSVASPLLFYLTASVHGYQSSCSDNMGDGEQDLSPHASVRGLSCLWDTRRNGRLGEL